MKAQIDYHTFNYITPVELEQMVEAYNSNKEYDLYLCWLNASLSKASKIPPFHDLKPKGKVNVSSTSKYKMNQHEINIHHNRFIKEGRLLLIG